MKALRGALLLLLMSCGFQSGSGSLSDSSCTICIPYVEGDRRGHLTEELIKEVVRSGAFQYDSRYGDLTLAAEVVELRTEGIGYRYDRERDGSLSDRMTTSERRVVAVAEITLFETDTGKTVLGPVRVAASTDYDHDRYADANTLSTFSLGQVNDVDLAEDVAALTLDRALAKRIVDYLSHAW